MALAEWYMLRARIWAVEAGERRKYWTSGRYIRQAQDMAAVYATLAQQAAARYGESR